MPGTSDTTDAGAAAATRRGRNRGGPAHENADSAGGRVNIQPHPWRSRPHAAPPAALPLPRCSGPAPPRPRTRAVSRAAPRHHHVCLVTSQVAPHRAARQVARQRHRAVAQGAPVAGGTARRRQAAVQLQRVPHGGAVGQRRVVQAGAGHAWRGAEGRGAGAASSGVGTRVPAPGGLQTPTPMTAGMHTRARARRPCRAGPAHWRSGCSWG